MPARLSEAFIHHPVHLNQNQIDFNSAKEVPDSFTWPPLHDDSTLTDFGYDVEPSVAVIDLSDPINTVKGKIGCACESWGVFQITNHGVPMNLLEKVQKEGKRLFSLPLQQKLKAARSPDGTSGYGVARISSFFPKHMWSEGFTIVGSVVDHARQLWPQDYINFCEVMEEYEKEMKLLAGRLMWLMLGSLGINKEDLQWAGPEGEFKDACGALQLNSYPACPDPDRAMGLAAHTDSTLLTVLHQNSTSGLQVTRDGRKWITVPPISGALVVNIGDLLHILSNGRYPSVLHRAVVNRKCHRLSVAYLYGPPMHVQVAPLSKLVNLNNPPLYRPVTWSEYLGTKAKHFNNALSSVRLCAPLNGSAPLNGTIGVKDHNSVKGG